MLRESSRRPTLTACFAHFGIELKNKRRTWADESADGEVVVTLWIDHFVDPLTYRSYSTAGRADLHVWIHRRENHRRAELLSHVGEGGTFQSIVISAAKLTEVPRRAVQRFIGPRMRLTKLNEATGEFSAERIDWDREDRPVDG